jgi:hypothetical protein
MPDPSPQPRESNDLTYNVRTVKLGPPWRRLRYRLTMWRMRRWDRKLDATLDKLHPEAREIREAMQRKLDHALFYGPDSPVHQSVLPHLEQTQEPDDFDGNGPLGY